MNTPSHACFITITCTKFQIEKLAQSKIDEYLVPSLPSFVRTAQTLVGVIINDINDTDAIARYKTFLDIYLYNSCTMT